jgi:hypothetical protein
MHDGDDDGYDDDDDNKSSMMAMMEMTTMTCPGGCDLLDKTPPSA